VYKGLFTYQRAAVEFLAARQVAFLCDAMGLGKSAQAIRAADLIGALRLLIICPAIARTNWKRELAKFGLLPRKVQVITCAAETVDSDADVVVVSYDLAATPAIWRQLLRLRFDILIADEAHALKSRTARRTGAVYGGRCDGEGGLIGRAQRVWLLTGTPMPNHAGEVWTHLNALLPGTITAGPRRLTHPEFLERYCVIRPTQYGPRVVGNRNVVELRHLLQPHALRRRAENVLRDLPTIRFTTAVVDPGEALADLEAAEAVPELALLRSVLDAANAKTEIKADAADERDVLIERVLKAESIALARLRRLTGVAKATAAVRLLRDELANGVLEKMVVFAHHREVLRTLAAGLARFGVVSVDGDTSPRRRQQAIDCFQNDPSSRVFLGQITPPTTCRRPSAATASARPGRCWSASSASPARSMRRSPRCCAGRPACSRRSWTEGGISCSRSGSPPKTRPR
jgi:SNF2 family DNA or RNA helicase